MNQLTHSLKTFLDSSPVSAFAQKTIEDSLKQNHFQELPTQTSWQNAIHSNKSYYCKPRDFNAIIAWKVGTQPNELRMTAAHTDSPLLKLKLQNDTLTNSQIKIPHLIKTSIDVYGGPILSTWLDRELSLAGWIYYKKGKEIQKKLIDLKDPIAIIPNLAIHLNREINSGFAYNPQTHLQPICAISSYPSSSLPKRLQEYVDSPILGSDLFFYDSQKAQALGLNKELLASGRLDNQAMCHSLLQALISCQNPQGLCVSVFFDNEEIGSLTSGGANSAFLSNILERIYVSLGYERAEILRIFSEGFLISADMAHAKHPSYPEKYDPDFSPELGKGPVIKNNAKFRYGSTGYSTAFFKMLCEESEVPYQELIMRSDMPSGTTIGPITNALSTLRTVDVGNSLLGMHSIRETISVQDHTWMTQVLTNFYGRKI